MRKDNGEGKMETNPLNYVYSNRATRRRYEVWFLKVALADGSGAWWFRYLMTNPGRRHSDGSIGGCATLGTHPVQIWATWFPRAGKPQSFIQGFPIEDLNLSAPGEPLQFQRGENRVWHDGCAGRIEVDGHAISWDLRYRSTAGFSMSDVGWIGFSRTPHTDAVFEGEIVLDGRRFGGSPLGYGLQGHNCGFRHRHLWTWAHCLHRGESGATTTFEALEYEIGLGIYFRRGLLWHEGTLHQLKRVRTEYRDRSRMLWAFECRDPKTGVLVRAEIDGSGSSLQRLPYTKTDCTGTFEVCNNSLARANLIVRFPGRPELAIPVNAGAVLEVVGE